MKKLSIIIIAIWLPFLGYSQGCTDAGPDERLRVFGFIQPQYNYSFNEDGGNTFLWNRARLGVTGNVPYDFQYYAVAELSPSFTGQPFLLDAYVAYTRFKWAKMAVGQFKSPFTLELQTPCHKLNTIYRSEVVFNLAAPLRDMGLMFYGGNDTTFFKYQFAIMNGSGLNTYDDNKGKDYVGRVIIQPFAQRSILGIGASVRYGSSAPAMETAVKDDTRFRYGLEGNLRYNNWTLQAEYVYGEDVGSYTTGGGCGAPGEVHEGSINREGWYVTAMYMTDWYFQPVVKVEYYDSDIDSENQLAYITTLGFNYFPNEWTRVQANYMLVNSNQRVDSQLGDNPLDNLLMIQVQVQF